jgi:hypothetical protein
MNVGDTEKFQALVKGVFALYRADSSQAVLDIWWATMRPYDFAAVKDAFNRHAVNPDNGQFLPKPADIVKLLEGGTADGALIAWTKVDRAAMRVGQYQSVLFDDPVIHAVIRDMGGWAALCDVRDNDWTFRGKEFQTRYRGYRLRGSIGEYPTHLVGIAEGHNSTRGFRIDPPVMIGDPEVCERVRLGGSGHGGALKITSQPVGDLLPAVPEKAAA